MLNKNIEKIINLILMIVMLILLFVGLNNYYKVSKINEEHRKAKER